MDERTAVSVDLKRGQREFLEQVVRDRGLEDVGKVVRCLVNYARENPDAHAIIFDEVRCLDC
jgi:hypothetical protein